MLKLTFFSICKKKNKSNVEIIEENYNYIENSESNSDSDSDCSSLLANSYETEIQFENPIPWSVEKRAINMCERWKITMEQALELIYIVDAQQKEI